jgi:type I restriction enzyme R subunit
MPRFTEKSVVEDYFIKELVGKGWHFVPSDELNRESLEEPLLTNNLLRALNRLNADIGIGAEEIKQVLNELKLKASGIEGSKQILNFFKSGVAVKFEKERVVKYVRLFDYDNIQNNEFIISRQVSYQSGDKTIRADIMLYINGIPLAIIECKNPVSFSANWFEGYRQIKDYEKAVPELFKYVQIGIAAEQLAKYFPTVPWQEEVKLYEWREEEKDSIDSTIEFLSPVVLLDIIRNFLFFRVEMGNATKVVTRYMQYRAANKIVDRVLNHLEGKEKKNKGLIWHWQGSGKTLTMIFAANKLYQEKRLENPTIFFIVDRIELEEQLCGEFASMSMSFDLISSIGELRKAIRHDEGRGRRGIMLTLIHKFRPEEMDELRRELNELAQRNKETIQTRKNVIAFIDEGHRTQYGMLAAQMKSILKNAFLFAFTGTPISKRGKDTYWEFSYPPEEAYFDKYFITDSIKDGFTVRIAYQPRLEKEVHLKKDLLETFLEVEYEELPEDIREKVKESVGGKLNTIKVVLENPERIKRVSEDIAEHFRENVEGRFKAMAVAVSREACIRYKRELDKLLPKEYSEVVMTFTKDDAEIIQSYLKELRERFKGKEIEDIRKDIVEKFKEEEFPKLLIVTDMLLTGFDAPVLQTMYLDKPLKEHKLLQAIARTNRPYKSVKEAGLILDYVGMLRDFVKAFEMYSKDEIKGALFNLDEIRTEFTELINNIMKTFEGIPKDQHDRETLLKAFEILTSDENTGKKFLEDYKLLRRLFELLGPDEIKVEHFSEYTWITAIYIYYTKQVLRTRPEEERYAGKYFDKTIKYVHKTTQIENLKKDLPVIVFDENYLQNLEEKVKSKEEKAANIVFTLNRFVLVDKQKNPIYETLTDKVERILKLWKEKTKDFEKIYREGSEVIEEINRLSARQKELGFSDMEYSLLLILEKRFGGGKEWLIKDVRELSEALKRQMFAGWVSQPTIRKNIERELRTFLRKKYVNKPEGITYKEIDDLCFTLKEDIETYGKAA